MMLALPGARPSDSMYLRTIGPLSETDPASARPKPSRMVFLPSSITLAGMSSYFVLTTNSATYFVRPGDLGNSVASQDAGGAAGVDSDAGAGEASSGRAEREAG